LILLIVAAVAFILPCLFQRAATDIEQQKFFVQEVEQGRRELSKDRALELMERLIAIAEAERRVSANALQSQHDFGFGLFAWALIQLGTVLFVRSRQKKAFSPDVPD